MAVPNVSGKRAGPPVHHRAGNSTGPDAVVLKASAATGTPASMPRATVARISPPCAYPRTFLFVKLLNELIKSMWPQLLRIDRLASRQLGCRERSASGGRSVAKMQSGFEEPA